MNVLFYLAASIALLATIAVLTARNAIHGLLYFITSLLAVAVIFLLIGAPFVATLEIIIYAGAIMVLFVFAVMVLGLGEEEIETERRSLIARAFAVPLLLSASLAAVLAFAIAASPGITAVPLLPGVVGPRAVAHALLGPNLLGVEIASLLLLAGLIGALHLGRRGKGDDRW